MTQKSLRELRRGETVNGVFLVETANFKQARNGKPFIQMALRDSSASVKALRWEANREEFREVERHPFLMVNGRAEEFHGNLQIIIDEMSSLSADDANVNPAEFLPRTPHNIDAMRDELQEIIAGIPDAAVRKLVETVLERPGVAEGLCSAPAGKVMHHAYIGGLLEHVLSLARLSLKVLEHYPWLDRSTLLAGVVLHDLGKIEELSFKTGFGYTDEGQLLGHIVLILSWIDEAALSVPGLDPEVLLHLKHVVASHHGKLEFGSPKIPMTSEAITLNYLDNLDAKLAGFRQAFQDAQLEPDGERWGDYNPMMGSRLYFPRHLDRLPRPRPKGPKSKPRSPDDSPQGQLPFAKS